MGSDVLFFFDPVSPVSGKALVMMSPAWKASEMRKSWISFKGATMVAVVVGEGRESWGNRRGGLEIVADPTIPRPRLSTSIRIWNTWVYT